MGKQNRHAVTARPDTEDYRSLFLSDAPMMDMRAPAEFAHGAFPSATSLPLMTDEERAQVGICYKRHGQAAAIELGHSIVSGQIRQGRMAHWLDFARSHPQGYLYCFRGGLRSQTVQHWLHEAGTDYPLARIADLCGFSHVEYMCHLFKTRMGQTPGQYRKRSQVLDPV